MKKLNIFRRGIIGALLLLGAATPFALTSCDNEQEVVNITLKSDYSGLAAAMNDANKSLADKLGMIEEAIKNGSISDNDAQELLIQAIKNINGTLSDKLAAIEQAITSQTTSLSTKLGLIEAAINGGFANDKAALDLIKEALGTLNGTAGEKLGAIDEALKSQTTSLETKLGLIQAAIETGLADQKTALGELKTAIESLKGSLDNIDGSIDDIVTALNGLNDTLGTDIADLLQDIKDSIAGLQDYSEILAAIKTAIENIGVVPDERVVDLGLSVKWSSMNIGASKPEEAGDYFAWGEAKPYYIEGHIHDHPCTSWVTGKEAGYDWPSYFDTKDGGTTFDTYATDKATKLKPEHDAAYVNWGGAWRMPTAAEMEELKTNCTVEWTKVNGVVCYKLTSKINGNSILLPVTGDIAYESFTTNLLMKDGELYISLCGTYWSSSLSSDDSEKAHHLSFNYSPELDYGGEMGVSTSIRCMGKCIRAVCP